MLTLRHPDLCAGGSHDALYAAKDQAAVQGCEELFHRFAGEAGALEGNGVKTALGGIGLRPDDFSVAGILQRHAASDPSRISSKEEFAGVVREAWGQTRSVGFDSRLKQVHEGVQGHAPLEGLRALVFVGRESPINWVMRLMRHSWPYAINRVVIMRNRGPNPDLDPELMEEFFPWVIRDYSKAGLTTASELAQSATGDAATAAGGFVVRMESFCPDAPTTYVPLRGLPENAPPGGLANFWHRLTKR